MEDHPMTPHDDRDDRETTASPQALVRDLCAQAGALPETLRQQCMAAGATVVPALITLLEAGLADDQAEPEGALFQAVDLLGALGDARAVPILLRCLEHDDLFDGLALPAAAALRTLGPAALEGCLAAYALTTDEAFRDRLAGVLSRCGVHDERIYACLVETLQRTPELGANYLAEYGEARALDVLAHAFDTLPLRDEESPLANHVFIELRAAIEDLGGQLTAAQTQKFEAADAARRRFVAQMSWDADPAAASAWRTPLEAASVAGLRPPTPSRARKLGRNAPCWCGSGKKYKKCHLPLERP
jgi:SEC-C motif